MFFTKNTTDANSDAIVMYVDMNSFFASCEQQLNPALRYKPIGVCTHESPYACVIAPSIEAKKYGVKTGMRLNDCRKLCPDIIPVAANPVSYRKFHIAIMEVLQRYCPDVMAKSIDEAALNLTDYRLVYADITALAKKIKKEIAIATETLSGQKGQVISCSIGIAPNTFLAKLGTEIQKPDGLIQITPENIDSYLEKMKLTDLPGIAHNNARKLESVGIATPLLLRHTSESILRRVFGGIVGYYWYARLHFMEVDYYSHDYRAMSAARTLSSQQRASAEMIDGILISLCNKLEQRLVKQKVFCRQGSFFVRYMDGSGWEARLRFPEPLQDAMELRSYIFIKINKNNFTVLNNKIRNMGVVVMDFLYNENIQYNLFENRQKKDKLRAVVYNIKDTYGKYAIRKGAELGVKTNIKDAIGFGSVKDLFSAKNNDMNQFLLEEMDE